MARQSDIYNAAAGIEWKSVRYDYDSDDNMIYKGLNRARNAQVNRTDWYVWKYNNYDASGNLYYKQLAIGRWDQRTILNYTYGDGIFLIYGPSTTASGNLNMPDRNVREVYTDAALGTESGSQLRFTLFNDNNSEDLPVTSFWVGFPTDSDGPHFTTQAIEVTFGGTRGVTISPSSTEVSDWVDFEYDGTGQLMIHYHIEDVGPPDTPNIVRRTTPANAGSWLKTGDDDLGAASGTGYSSTSTNVWITEQIELQ